MKSRIVILMLTVLSTVGILAEEERTGFELFYGFGHYDYGTPMIDSAEAPVIALGYNLSNQWAVELIHISPDTQSPTEELDVDWGAVRGVYSFMDEGSFSPYISAGYADMDLYGSERDLVMGLGIKAYATERFSFRIETNYHAGEGDRSVFAMIGYQFGGTTGARDSKPQDSDMDGVIDSLDACPKTPRGSKVDDRGCVVVEKPAEPAPKQEMDTDGDGVMDGADKCPNTPAGALVDENGCQKELDKEVSVDLAINFATSSDVVGSQYDSELARVADFMKQYAGTSVVIEGHTDSTGRAEFNQSLSEKRAASVASALINRFGVDASRISSVGYGEANPIASNDTVDGRQANRRVVAVINQTVTEKQWQE